MTGRHQGPKQKLGLVTERHHYNARPIYVSGFYGAQVLFFIVECGITCFSVRCAYLTFRQHPHPVGYLCAKFCFFCILNHSISHPAYSMPGNHSFHFKMGFKSFQCNKISNYQWHRKLKLD